MNSELDAVVQKIAELSATVKEHQTDKATLDVKELAAEITRLQQGMIDAQPVRKGEVEGFGAKSDERVRGGKYDGMLVDDMVAASWILDKAGVALGKKFNKSSALEGVVTKALTATGSATGDEYVPTGLAASLWDDFFVQARVVSQFPVIPMPTDPFDIPLGWGDPTWRKGTQNTATTASDPATAKSTLTSTEQVIEIDWAYDLDEDAVIATLPTLRSMISRSGAEQMDKFLMNSDATDAGTGNINLDDADPDADMYYLTNGQDGLRHLYIVDNTGQSADINTTLTDALMRAGIGRLGKYSVDTGGLVMFVDPETYVNGMLALTNVVTVDKFGSQATVLTGQLANYSGIAVIPTSSIAEAEDDGKLSTTPANNNEGQICIVHKDMWRIGFRRQLLFEMWRDIKKRQLVLVASFRIAVAARGTRSAAVHTAGIHGIVRA